MRWPAVLAGAALLCASPPAATGAQPAGYPALDRMLLALAAIDRDYPDPVDLKAVAARGAGAIRDRAQADPAPFEACIAGRPSRGSDVRGAADALLDALECAKAPPERYDPLIDSALEAMIGGLDERSRYFGPAEYRALLDATDGGHVGLRVTPLEGGFAVAGTEPATPARAAGVKAGERLLAIGGRDVSGLSLEQVETMLSGAVGSEAVLTLAAPGGPARELSLTRVPPGEGLDLEAETRDGVLLLHVHRLGRGLEAALGRAIRDRPERPRAVILDLRSNPGGLLDVALWLADQFVDRARIVESRGKGKRSKTYRGTKGELWPGVPLVVLVDGGTASGAEIVAAALQDNRRAIVVGAATVGAGTVQTLFPIDRDRAIRLTTSHEYRVDGRRLQDAPVVPDCPAAGFGEAAVAPAVAVALGDRAACAPSPAPAARSR